MRAIFAAVAILLVSACSGQSFERDEAAKLIAETEQASALGQRVSTYQGYLEDGEAQGLWSTEDSSTPIVGVAASPELANLGPDFIEPATPVKIIVTVTGMTEIPSDGTATSAEFDWSYGELPKHIKRFALLGGTGQASFQKFDDGWRVSSVSFSRPDGRAELSSAEMDEVKTDTAKETARRNAIIERIRTSFAEGKPIKRFDAKTHQPDSYHPGPDSYYVISENGVSYFEEVIDNFRNTGNFKKKYYLWFGEIFNLREGRKGIDFDNHSWDNHSYHVTEGLYYERLDVSRTMDSKAFLQALISAHTAWTQKYGDLPANLRNKIYLADHKAGVPRGEQ